MLGVTGGIELSEKEMACEFGFSYFQRKLYENFN